MIVKSLMLKKKPSINSLICDTKTKLRTFILFFFFCSVFFFSFSLFLLKVHLRLLAMIVLLQAYICHNMGPVLRTHSKNSLCQSFKTVSTVLAILK